MLYVLPLSLPSFDIIADDQILPAVCRPVNPGLSHGPESLRLPWGDLHHRPVPYAVDEVAVGELLQVRDPLFFRSRPARSSSDLYLPHFLRSILRRASADEISRLIARAFHEDVLGPFQDSMASLDPEVLAEDAEDSSSVLDFPVQSALLLLSVLKEEVRDPSQ